MKRISKPTESEIQDTLGQVATEAVAARVVEWFSTEEGQIYLSDSIGNFAENVELNEEEFSLPNEIRSDKMRQHIELQLKTWRLRRVISIVASVAAVLFVALSYVAYKNAAEVRYEHICCDAENKKQITLSDGTTVVLHSSSAIRFVEGFSENDRVVYLEGEADFDVAKDAKRVFVVNFGDSSLEVLGTSFNVKAYSDENLVIEVETGVVGVRLPAAEEKIIVEAGDKIEYDIVSNRSVLSKRSSELVFKGETMQGVIDTLESMYNVNFDIQNRGVLQNTFTFTIKEPTLESILADIEILSDVEFEIKGDLVMIK